MKSATIEPNFPLGNMDSTSLGLIGRRTVQDLEAGKPTLQLGKALQVIATLGCDVQIVSPASRRS